MDSKQSNVKFVVAGLLLGLFMSALDQTIVSTAMTTIIKKLGGFESFVWVYSAYMIAMVVSTPVFGKLSDIYGRKRFFLFGLVIFLVGSVLCGTATTMNELIIYRALQGIGGGIIMPIVFTMIFDLFPMEKRGKMMGLFGAVFGISSVFGPIMGGAITDYMSWNWIFYINVPIGLLSIFFIARGYHETRVKRKQNIDWGGVVFLMVFILCLMFGLELGGREGWAWGSLQTNMLFIVSGIFFVLFILMESKAKDPIVKLDLFRNRVFTSSMMISMFYGAVMIGCATYIPIFVQGVFLKTATQTSTVLTPMMLAVVVSSQIGGRVVTKFKYRDTMIVSALTLIVGTLLLGYAMGTGTSEWLVTLYMIIIGLGIGVSFSLLNISTLNAVPPQYKGSASSLITFFRTIGSALGVTVLGTLQKYDFQEGIRAIPDLSPQLADKIKGGQALLDPEMQEKMGLPASLVTELLNNLANSILFIFQWSVILPIAALIFAILMGRSRMQIAGKQGQGKPEPDQMKSEEVPLGKPEPSYHGG
ncbi:MAG: MDR family MFS transporter [Candidatus Cohnella colombiensis]|uniref:MDR family MFS transporter n=1 Tax=Candidatus Cohnella colombiensis TaxID=3121368 RepID=A0AA95ETW5_9BACL|nr:MAG: MDR family MFS transporter [Cohnella sp.]